MNWVVPLACGLTAFCSVMGYVEWTNHVRYGRLVPGSARWRYAKRQQQRRP